MIDLFALLIFRKHDLCAACFKPACAAFFMLSKHIAQLICAAYFCVIEAHCAAYFFRLHFWRFMNFSFLHIFLRKLKNRVFFAICEFDDFLTTLYVGSFAHNGNFVLHLVKCWFWKRKRKSWTICYFFDILQADISTTA